MSSVVLNWREIAEHAESLSKALQGLHVDRVLVPERPRFPDGYVKGEWALRLKGRSGERTLVFSVRPRIPYLAIAPGKGPRASERGTRSVFDLTLSKRLKGMRIAGLEAVPRDRCVLIWFGVPGDRVALILYLIPATPEALLVKESGRAAAGRTFEIQAHTRKTRTGQTGIDIPDSGEAPESVVSRGAFEDPEAYGRQVQESLDAEAYGLRITAAEKHVRDHRKDAAKQEAQNKGVLDAAKGDPDWLALGKLLTAHLHAAPEIHSDAKSQWCEVPDFETGALTRIPLDPKLTTLSEQAERLFNQSRRARRRAETSEERLQEARRRLGVLDEAAVALSALKAAGTVSWERLAELEARVGLGDVKAARGPSVVGGAAGAPRNRKAWPGRAFVSTDGMAIWAGRTVDENLELTFKYSKGNDVWMHLRGRPGAHLLIPLAPGKSAPLETLLDGANLAIHLSGGQSWGKTDVDYAPVRNVKRIKGSTEVQYTGNKTLSVQPDPVRLKRLLG